MDKQEWEARKAKQDAIMDKFEDAIFHVVRAAIKPEPKVRVQSQLAWRELGDLIYELGRD